jgi:hypothetical protein
VEHVWTVVCQQRIDDKRSNNVSLINILEQVAFVSEKELNAIPISLDVVTMWRRSRLDQPEQATARLSLMAPDEQVLLTQEYAVDLSAIQRLRASGEFNGLPFHGTGTYRFIMELQENGEWHTVASIPVDVIEKEPQDSP